MEGEQETNSGCQKAPTMLYFPSWPARRAIFMVDEFLLEKTACLTYY